jgi:2-dehydro-3-deoxygalactonokinase
MPQARFIAGDWGTSHLRIGLCDESGAVLAAKDGPGVAALGGKLAETFASLTADWDAAHGALPAVLCGMAGSTLGWREVPYLSCPVHPQKIADGALRFEASGRTIAIAPGLSCRNRLMAPDVMRGEETQILGALGCDPALAHGRHFLCMPGTHSKWAILQNGTIENFLTGVTGELFDILSRRSVLVGAQDRPDAVASAAFARALEQTRLHPDAELVHLLFETRSRQLAGELRARDAASYLSGLIVGQDVAGVVRLFKDDLAGAARVTVIGAPDLRALYATALESRRIAVRQLDGADAAVAGLATLYRTLFSTGLAHAS